MKVRIDKMVFGGSGLGRVDGKPVFVSYAAPGDLLEVEITSEHESYSEAKILKIIEASSERVKPRCPVFESCGGCQWQHLKYESQLFWKREILKESIERIAKISDPNVLATLASPDEWNYRNRIQLHVSANGKVGFHRARSNEIIEFQECHIAEKEINEELEARREKLRGRDRGIALRREDGPAFAQVNTGQNEQVRGVIVEWLSEIPHSSVLELYAGAGNFTFDMAKIAERVVASDVDKRAIESAKLKALDLGAGNIEFTTSPSGKAVGRMQGQCDVVFLDPPRKGAADAISDILKLAPTNIIYMSCNPTTMARDIKDLCESGYRFERSLPIDMFPQTFHIESLTHLSKL